MKKVVLEARSLVKRYKNRSAVDGVQLKVLENQCYALLGIKGSGKTSLLKCLSTVSELSAGDIFISNLNIRNNLKKIRHLISFVPDVDEFDDEFNVIENILNHTKFYNLNSSKTEQHCVNLLRLFNLDGKLDCSLDELSNFEKRKLSFVRALSTHPKILFIDEPTAKLNVSESKYLVSLISELKKEDLSILFSTENHLVAERLADTVGIMSRGKIIQQGTAKELISENIGNEVLEFDCREEDVRYILSRLGTTYDFRLLESKFHLFLKDGQDGKNVLNFISSDDVNIRKPYLSDVVTKFHPNAIEFME